MAVMVQIVAVCITVDYKTMHHFINGLERRDMY